ncbi:hypothetical protein J2T57_001375 [Natronocella acetinitrilica]|uniref:DotD/TraH family lipoprotein n=1 Tax=Natronocella acetinitrilica TaxID=414046 RepID=A0AAE3G331_9GAMM|nr:DotD/TraH family lipoprotein [Natronocella acetinitrilica]MCP1674273.1 hypothetical protein [Natronocella acetinitrilica]
MKAHSKLLVLAIASLLATGCATTQPVEPDGLLEEQRRAENEAWEQLRMISVEARDELRLLAKAQQSLSADSMTPEQHAQKSFQSTYVPEGFKDVVSFRHIGPATRAAEALAKIAGYEFETYGVRPAHEPVVSIEVTARPLIEALHELGMQTGDAIHVEVFEASKLMRVIYR